MPLTAKGEKILESMEETYGSEKKAKSVLYASKNAGKIKGIDASRAAHADEVPDQQQGIMGIKKSQTLERDQFAGAAARGALGGIGSSLIGGSSGSAQRTASTMLSPMSPVSTASQSQENAIMGRPANAGPFGGTPSTQVASSDVDVEGPKGTLKMPADIPTEEPKTYAPGGPSGVPDKTGRRNLSSDRPPDKQIGTLKDYAAAAGAKK